MSSEDYYCVALIVHARFEHSTYSIREDLISLNPVIILSQSSLQSLTLPINLMDISTGAIYVCMYVYCCLDNGIIP